MACKICSSPVIPFGSCDFHANATRKHGFFEKPMTLSGISVEYLKCMSCGFVFTEHMDAWTPEQWQKFVYTSDYDVLDGGYNGGRSGQLANLLYLTFRDNLGKLDFLDYGGGLGLASELIGRFGARRAITYDPYVATEKPVGKFNVITCAEVLEHSTDPRKTIAEMASFLAEDSLMICTTEIIAPDATTDWWYVVPRVGHVSFYTQKALKNLYGEHGLGVMFIGENTHVVCGLWPEWAKLS